MKTRRLLCALAVVPLCACASSGGRTAVPGSPLQQRELESRTYPASDAKAVMRAVLGALQDDGFIVRTADADLGLISATRESARRVGGAQKAGRLSAIVMTYGAAALLSWPEDSSSIVEATANVAALGQETRLRLNFQVKRLDKNSHVKDVRSVLDARVYQEFFSRVDKGLFLQREKLEPSSDEE